jgi:hypothetical protein
LWRIRRERHQAPDGRHAFALVPGSTVDAWGANELGNDTTTNASAPIGVVRLSRTRPAPQVSHIPGLFADCLWNVLTGVFAKHTLTLADPITFR